VRAFVKRRRNMRHLLALAAVVTATLVAAGTGSAGREQMTLTCTGLGTIMVTVTTTTNDHSVAWGVGTDSSGLVGIPVSFSGTATDLLTTNTVLPQFSFFQAKGNGNGMHNFQTVACTTPPQTATAGALGLPEINSTDMIQLAFTAQVVPK
jgi:hypothetical protein